MNNICQNIVMSFYQYHKLNWSHASSFLKYFKYNTGSMLSLKDSSLKNSKRVFSRVVTKISLKIGNIIKITNNFAWLWLWWCSSSCNIYWKFRENTVQGKILSGTNTSIVKSFWRKSRSEKKSFSKWAFSQPSFHQGITDWLYLW